jgi:hypothetical protein
MDFHHHKFLTNFYRFLHYYRRNNTIFHYQCYLQGKRLYNAQLFMYNLNKKLFLSNYNNSHYL